VSEICGWSIEHRDTLRYETTGNVRLSLKIQSYAEHNQIVKIIDKPQRFKLVKKGANRFLAFNGILGKKGAMELVRRYEVFPVPFKMREDISWGRVSDIPPELANKYREPSRYWPINSDRIRAVEGEMWFKEQDIKKWVLGAERYLWKTIKNAEPQERRLGAEKAYTLGTGDCDEFADLFITLARIRGIPARRVTGFYIHNQHEAHAWSEIYLPSRIWIPVDMAMHIIGEQSMRHVIMKVEEFNPSIGEYRLTWKGGKLKYTLKRNEKFEPIYC